MDPLRPHEPLTPLPPLRGVLADPMTRDLELWRDNCVNRRNSYDIQASILTTKYGNELSWQDQSDLAKGVDDWLVHHPPRH